MKKFLALCLTALMVLSLIPAFAEGSEPTVIHLLVPAHHDKITGMMVEAFNASHDDIQVEYDASAVGWDGVSTKLITMLAGGEDVDIACVSTSYYPQFVDLNQVYDITEHAEQNYSEDEYYWSVFDGLKVDGHLYGVPSSIYTLVNYYNKDAYDEAGLEYPPMEWGEGAWTFEEWADTARALTHGEGLDRQYGAWIEYQLERTACFLFPKGLNYWGENLEPQFDNEEIRAIHETVYSLLHDEHVIPDNDLVSTAGASQLFVDGSVINYINGTWEHSAVATADFNLGVCPTPGGVTVGYVDVYIPMAGTKHPDEMLTVLDYLIGYDACVMKYTNNELGPQVNKKATEDCKANCFSGLSPEEVDCIFASLDNCIPLTVFPQWAEFLEEYLLPASTLMRTGEYTVTEGFDELQQDAKDLLGF